NEGHINQRLFLPITCHITIPDAAERWTHSFEDEFTIGRFRTKLSIVQGEFPAATRSKFTVGVSEVIEIHFSDCAVRVRSWSGGLRRLSFPGLIRSCSSLLLAFRHYISGVATN